MAPATQRPSIRSSRTHRSSTSVQKSEIIINVYDLLPPGKLSSTLWFLGSSLLHTGVYIKSLNREYAFGGHSVPNLTGVYYTTPGLPPPGGTIRAEILQGFTLRPNHEIEKVIREVSACFPGQGYHLLRNNCNHFSSYLCEVLIGRGAPGWMNRAARVGVILPCLVPREWIEPDEEEEDREREETAQGELLDEEADERTAMLKRSKTGPTPRPPIFHTKYGSEDQVTRKINRSFTTNDARDAVGRRIPPSERAPIHL